MTVRDGYVSAALAEAQPQAKSTQDRIKLATDFMIPPESYATVLGTEMTAERNYTLEGAGAISQANVSIVLRAKDNESSGEGSLAVERKYLV